MAPSPPIPRREGPGHGLVVERASGQSVMIGDQIEIVLLRVKGNRAHLGVVAPEGVKVARVESHRSRGA
jgi:carbon storage regulator